MGFSVLTYKKPFYFFAAVILLRFAIPSPASEFIVGNWQGAWSFHPASWLVVSGAVVLLPARTDLVARDFLRAPGLYYLCTAFIVVSSITTLVGPGAEAMLRYCNVAIVPMLFFVMIRVFLYGENELVRRLAYLIVLVITMQAVLALAQWYLDSVLVFEHYHRFQNWWPRSGVLGRSIGTSDSPLDLALILACGIPLSAVVKSDFVAYAIAVIASAGIIVSESRQGVIYGALALVFVVGYRSKSVVSAAISSILIILVFSEFVFDQIGGGLADRFYSDDGGSSRTRELATNFFIDNLQDYLVAGGGYGYSFSLRGSLLSSSLENGYAIFVFDFGLPAVVLLLLIQIAALFVRRADAAPYRFAAVLGVIMCFGYSSFATQSVAGLLLWTLIGLVSCFPKVESLGYVNRRGRVFGTDSVG
ncbi:hypothetical protein [Rhodococcus opacus]|uniref:hypothetical protein n=1 Tax=Rhodococcus opacus TaxID=37919 RepID=UPI000A9F2E00|nr:hypothetical protein [Rhodococcus opacus]